jgi:CelD/BcsL family acetyltransferase involved in cellulose biosynthesis
MAPEFQFLACHWSEPWGRHLMSASGWKGPILYVVTRNDLGKVVGAVPFGVREKAGLRFLSLAGSFVPFRGFPVAARSADAVADSLAEHLTRHHRNKCLRLAPVARKDPVCQPLIDRLERRGWRIDMAHNGYRQLIQLPDTWEEYAAERKGSRWKKVDKLDRRMRRDHEVTLQLYTSETCENWEAVVRDLGDIEDGSWLPSKDGDFKFSGPENRKFWTEVFHAQRRGLAARVWILYLDGKPVTFDFNFDSGPCRYSLAGHYVEDVKTFSTGTILFREVVKDAIERGVRTIDMGGGDPGYKKYWGAQPEDPIVDWTAFPPGIRGGLLHGGVRLAHIARRARSRVNHFRNWLATLGR